MNRKIKEMYNTHKNTNGVPVFELKDGYVKVTLTRDGKYYNGETTFNLSYEDFNYYLSKDVGREESNVWKDLFKELNEDEINFTGDTIGFEVKEGNIRVIEKVGGGTFPAFIHNGNEADFGSTYIIETDWGNFKDFNRINLGEYVRGKIKVLKVERVGGTLFQKEKERIPFLEDFLNKRIEESKITLEVYEEEGISIFFYTGKFENEIVEREMILTQEEKRKVNWGLL